MPMKNRNWKAEWAAEKKRAGVELPRRAARARARRAYDSAGKNRSGLDLDHKVPLSKGGSTKLSNVRAVKPSTNRSFPRNADGSIKRR